jgi:hypothetical protein
MNNKYKKQNTILVIAGKFSGKAYTNYLIKGNTVYLLEEKKNNSKNKEIYHKIDISNIKIKNS